MLYSLLYTSQAIDTISDDDLENILSIARRNHARQGITGMLLSYEKTFIQVLEGEEEAVKALYKKIEQDPRHETIELLYQDVAAERMFGSWKMGYLPIDENSLRSICGNFDVSGVDELCPSGEPALVFRSA